MSNTLRRVDYFYVMVPNRAGQGAKIMAGLPNEGVNLLAFSGFPSSGKAQLDLMPENGAKLRRAAKKLGLKISKRKTGFLYHADDRVGAMTGVLGEARRGEDQRHRDRRGRQRQGPLRSDFLGQHEGGRKGSEGARREVRTSPGALKARRHDRGKFGTAARCRVSSRGP